MTVTEEATRGTVRARGRTAGLGHRAVSYPAGMPDVLTGLTVGQIRVLARDAAQNVLAEYWTPGTLPVEPVTIARDLGLSVFAAQLDEDVFGMLVGSEAGADIYIDRNQPRSRFRFTCAHEIGHFVLRADEIAQGASFIDRRSDDDKGTADEVYANEFAGSLLMPEAALLAAVRAEADDFDLMRRFDVSLDALKYRRYILGF